MRAKVFKTRIGSSVRLSGPPVERMASESPTELVDDEVLESLEPPVSPESPVSPENPENPDKPENPESPEEKPAKLEENPEEGFALKAWEVELYEEGCLICGVFCDINCE